MLNLIFSPSQQFEQGWAILVAIVYQIPFAVCLAITVALFKCGSKKPPKVPNKSSAAQPDVSVSVTNKEGTTNKSRKTEGKSRDDTKSAAGNKSVNRSVKEKSIKNKTEKSAKPAQTTDVKETTIKFDKSKKEGKKVVDKSKLETGGISDISADRGSAFQSMFGKTAAPQTEKKAVASKFGEAPPTAKQQETPTETKTAIAATKDGKTEAAETKIESQMPTQTAK